VTNGADVRERAHFDLHRPFADPFIRIQLQELRRRHRGKRGERLHDVKLRRAAHPADGELQIDFVRMVARKFGEGVWLRLDIDPAPAGEAEILCDRLNDRLPRPDIDEKARGLAKDAVDQDVLVILREGNHPRLAFVRTGIGDHARLISSREGVANLVLPTGHAGGVIPIPVWDWHRRFVSP